MARNRTQSLKPFFVIWSGQAFSLFGSRLVQFALVWWMADTTASATVLAGASIVALLPQILLGPFAGALVDRWNRRAVMMVADSAIALATLLLAGLFAMDIVEVWHVYVLMFIRSGGEAFHWPAMQASTTLMVPEKHLSRVAGLNQTLQGLSNIISPPLGALLMSVLPMQSILAIDVSTALLAVGTLFFVFIPQPERKAGPELASPSVMADLREGLRFLRSWPGVMALLGIAMILNFLVNPAFALLPILVTDHFRGGVSELAGLESAWGIGVVAGGITLGVWGGFKRRAITGLLALTLQGIGSILIGLAPTTAFTLAVAAMFSSGFFNPIGNGSFFAVMQATIPPEMQGRIFTIGMSATAAMTPLGLAIAGPVADAIGVQIWFLIGGIGSVILGTTCFFIPAITHIEDGARALVGMAKPAAGSAEG